ncbi:MAG: kelch repeat-containing protein [Pseudomonadota bacterium]
MNRRSLLAAGGATAVSACLSNSPSKGDREIGMVEETSNTLEWRSAPSLSRPVQEIYPAMHGGEIWLSGGLVAEAGRITGPTVETHIFNRQSNAWRPGPALPTPRHHPHLQSHQGVLFCIGGFEVMAADAVWIMQNGGWKLTSNGWEPLTPAPSPIGEAVTASIGEGLHVCGGRQPKGEVNRDTADHTDVGAHHVLIADVWETAAPLPTPRNSATAEMINADWRVVGGRTVANGNSTAHEVYDSQEDRWRSAAPLPASRSGLASGVLDGRLYVFGGESLVGERDVFGDCWVYDPASDTWEEGPRMMTPRHGLGGVVLGDGLYAIGGAERPSGEATSNAVEVLDSIV